MRSLFHLKDKTSHVSFVLYGGKLNCGENYIGEIGRNVTIKWDGHSDVGKNSEPAESILVNFLNTDLIRKLPKEFQIK